MILPTSNSKRERTKVEKLQRWGAKLGRAAEKKKKKKTGISEIIVTPPPTQSKPHQAVKDAKAVGTTTVAESEHIDVDVDLDTNSLSSTSDDSSFLVTSLFIK